MSKANSRGFWACQSSEKLEPVGTFQLIRAKKKRKTTLLFAAQIKAEQQKERQHDYEQNRQN